MTFTTTSPAAWTRSANPHPSHHFDFEMGRCWDCDCRPWGLWSAAPCGLTEVDLEAISASTGVRREDAGDWLGEALAGR